MERKKKKKEKKNFSSIYRHGKAIQWTRVLDVRIVKVKLEESVINTFKNYFLFLKFPTL